MAIGVGSKLSIEKSFYGNKGTELALGDCISKYSSAQDVYKSVLGTSLIVVKILNTRNQSEFGFEGEKRDFSKVEFYGTCIDALRILGVPLPDLVDVVKLIDSAGTKKHLGFLQTFLQGDIVDDRKVLDLPDLGLIEGKERKGKIRYLHLNEFFYFTETGEVIFVDWDRYLLQLKKIAERTGVVSKIDLLDFKKRIINAY